MLVAGPRVPLTHLGETSCLLSFLAPEPNLTFLMFVTFITMHVESCEFFSPEIFYVLDSPLKRPSSHLFVRETFLAFQLRLQFYFIHETCRQNSASQECYHF